MVFDRSGNVRSGDHAVSSQRFRLVERGVGFAQERRRIGRLSWTHHRNTEAYRYDRAHRRGWMRYGELLDAAAQILGRDFRGLELGVRQKDHELLTAVAGYEVRAASCGALEDLRNTAQTLVALEMAAVVVVGFEVVDVGENGGYRGAVAYCVLPLPLVGLVEVPSVCDPGEPVGARDALEPVVGRGE